ncbi:MAG: methionine--tRNA ligase [Gemmatimonadota bacterium]
MSQERFYVTTAIDYANGEPHMGHAYEKVGADVVARYHRLRDRQVHFVIGMDEHGLKVYQKAEESGVSPQAWVDGIAARFAALWERLGISHDDFIRTTEPRHRAAVQEMVRRLEAAGDLYMGRYEGHYCVGCEAFKAEDELEAVDGTSRCPIHPERELRWTAEENWFFRLSRYRDRLLALLEERPSFIQPESRRNEIRRVLEGGLEDLSVSRATLPWGVPWPGDESHSVYVWIDALTNYLSAIGFPDEAYREWWPADLHVIGKDITRFHCIYWPAMLMSAGLELPRSVWGHGFITVQGAKLSKSSGERLDLDALVERHGVDAFRYYLLRDVPWNGDGEFSLERFDERYTSELADNLGNLANRVLSMVERYRDGTVPAAPATDLDTAVAGALVRYRAAMEAGLLHQGLAAAMELAGTANGFVDQRAPWKQAKDPDQAAELDTTLGALVRALGALATLLWPFMPARMEALMEGLNLPAPVLLDDVAELDLAGRTVSKPGVLFPKPERAPASEA